MGIELAVTLLWIIALGQSVLILVLYRQVGLTLLARSSAIAKDGPRVGGRLPAALASQIPNPLVAPDRTWSRLAIIFARERCSVCLNLWPELERFLTTPGGSTVAVVVVFDGERDAADLYRTQHRIAGTVLSDPSERLFTAAGVRVSPFAVVIDANLLVTRKGLVNHEAHLRLLTDVGGGDTPLQPSSQIVEGPHAVELVG